MRQHRDDCRLWVSVHPAPRPCSRFPRKLRVNLSRHLQASLRVGLVNHLGHDLCQVLLGNSASLWLLENFVSLAIYHMDHATRPGPPKRGMSKQERLKLMFSQELEVWVATWYATKKSIPTDADVEGFAAQVNERRRKVGTTHPRV